MRRLFMLLLLPTIVLGCSTAEKWGWSELQNLTRAAPSSASDGIDIGRAAAYRITVCPAAGQSLLTGTILMYAYNDVLAKWGRNSRQDLTLAGAATDVCENFDDFEVGFRGPARLMPASSGVTVSGGAQVTMRVDAWAD